MIVYLAGPITGNAGAADQFAAAEEKLKKNGCIVLNPKLLPDGLGDCDDYMKLCLPMIDMADAVIMLDGWKDSCGACREWGYAFAKDKAILGIDVFK